ncbi:MAG: glycerate kinase, partial [Lachnospiraceae bacterium]|nr:glycerate kinase [Lachnospiraceae bacterium]
PAGAPVQIMQNTQIPQILQSLQIPQNPQNPQNLQNTQQPPDQRVSAILATLESGMQNYKSIILKNYGIDPDWIKGAGAAGGLGAALSLFLGGKMQSGIETVLDLAGFSEALENADLVITGEGRLDAQSLKGKVVSGVAKIAKKKGVPVAAICGSVDASDTLISKLGLKNVFTLVDEETPLNEALAKAEECYYKTALKLFYRSPYLL